MTTAAAEKWWSLSDLPAGEIIGIEVRWSGRRMIVSLVAVQRKLRWCRVDEDARRVEWLPPPDERARFGIESRDAQPWSEHPDCWRPINPSWTWPYGCEPEPLPPHRVPRLWSETMRFAAVEDAEAAELAREMERDRETARVQGEHHDNAQETARRGVRSLWWRDPSRIVYADAGSIRRDHAEGRLMRAIASEGPVRIANGLGLHGTRVLARLSDTGGSALAAASARVEDGEVEPFEALPADHGDYAIAMNWLAALGTPGARTLTRRQTVLILAAQVSALSFAEIGRLLKPKIKRARVAVLYREAIDEVHAVANGARTKGVQDRDAALQRVQAANRAARWEAV